MWDLKISTAIDWPLYVFDANGDGIAGLVSADFTSGISKNGGNFSSMTVTITELTGATGWYKLALTSSHTDTLGVLTVTTSATGTKQINAQWRVVNRLADDLAFPETSGRSIKVSAAGAVDADLKLWLAAAPAALTTNGYVQAMLLRWLTDNAGGTPNALISGRVDANAQVVGDKTGYALTSTEEDAIVDKVWDEAQSGHTTAGTFGKRLDADVSTRAFPNVAGRGIDVDTTGGVEISPGQATEANVTRWAGDAVNPLITGRVDASVGEMQNDVLTKDAMSPTAGEEIADAVHDEVIEGTLTHRQIERIVLAVLAGESNGGTTSTIHFRDQADTKNRVTATVDTTTGNRTAVTVDGS